MSNEQVVSFRVQDTGVRAFMDSISQRANTMASEMIRDAQRQTQVAKDQLKIIEDRIRNLERENRLNQIQTEQGIRQVAARRIESTRERTDALYAENRRRFLAGEIDTREYGRRNLRIGRIRQAGSEEVISQEVSQRIAQVRDQARQNSVLNQQLRQIIAEIRTGAQEQTNAIRQGDTELLDAVEESGDPRDRLANQLATQDIRERQKKEKDKEEKPEWVKSMLAVANGVLIDRLGSMVSNLPNAKNELEYIKPMMSMFGMGIGGILGSLGDMVLGSSIAGFGLGKTSLGMLGIQVGEKMGEFAGSALERTYRSREDLSVSNFKLKALTGGLGTVENTGGVSGGIPTGGRGYISGLNQDYSRYGMSMKEVAELQYNLAGRMGTSSGLGKATLETLTLDKGYGVRQETSMALYELLRANREGDKDLGNIVGGVLERGLNSMFKGDRTYLNEFLTRNYTQLQRTMLQTQSSVASGTVFDVLNKFNKLGGEFSVQDPRSTNLINSIQSSLVNPGSDSMKALSFYIMRKNNPDMSLSDIGIETQKGLGSEKYFQSMMKFLTSVGGDESYQIYNVASAFGLQGNLSAAKKLLTGYREGAFEGGMSQEMLTSMGLPTGLAEQQTSYYARSTAEIENAFIESAVNGISEVKNKMTNLFGVMIDQLEDFIRGEIKKLSQSAKQTLVDNTTRTPGR